MITSRPSLSAVTSRDDAASVDDWCTCLEWKPSSRLMLPKQIHISGRAATEVDKAEKVILTSSAVRTMSAWPLELRALYMTSDSLNASASITTAFAAAPAQNGLPIFHAQHLMCGTQAYSLRMSLRTVLFPAPIPPPMNSSTGLLSL